MHSTWSLHGQTATLAPPLQEYRVVIRSMQQRLTKTVLALQQGLWVPSGTPLTGRKWIHSIWFTGASLTLCLRNRFLKDENFLSSCLLGKWSKNSCLILWNWGASSHSHGGVLAIEYKVSYHLQGGTCSAKVQDLALGLSLLTKLEPIPL